ncbi:hypothetical protein A1Q1_05807 [Trichosporon asahii var. asahii CBS 2479]|uniref:Expansin family protein n=1 Tax=Trichosporon asahii var. asahii (strain ATCC 90039 / CBS 2479 / JCM 2466 / KCTC 7840 / NBRC 103889/ NCYC 2677 / UAMH 7654) TaxID=1186058 RepID=J5Q614_TRIAS|nr:hypothetical protein A1Q1_05807 [Trichosporon asahii var. asahii CBS 2479]EJT45658.1 hypothetical protein A1Q1_05807 [Trichosporon asahii var. asahii CBS 2479]
MRLALVATTLFAALPALAASQNADGAVARGMGHTVNSRRAAHRAFARRGDDGERRGPNGKKCRPKKGKGSHGAHAGGNGLLPADGQSSASSASGSASASASGASASATSSSVGNEFYQSEPSSSAASSASSSVAPSSGAPSASASSEGAAPSSEGAASSSAAATSTSESSAAPSPSASSGGNNNSGGGGSSGDLSWLNGADPNVGEQGEASFYDVAGGNTYCGGHFSNDDAVVALSQSYWNQITGGGYSTGPPCGKKISITWNGITKECTVQDMCPECPPNKLDLARGFWKSFTGGDESLGILGLQDKPENGGLQWNWL